MENSIIREQARMELHGNWGKAAGFVFVFGLIGSIDTIIGKLIDSTWVNLLTVVIGVIISTGVTAATMFYFLNLSRGEVRGYGEAIKFGASNVWPFFKLTFAIGLKTFAWLLLFIIPGIIAGIRYSQAYFIKIDNPHMLSFEAINESKRLMKGNKWKYFCLGFSFIGWTLLSLLTLGIGMLWVTAYSRTAFGKFYDDLISGPRGLDFDEDRLNTIS